MQIPLELLAVAEEQGRLIRRSQALIYLSEPKLARLIGPGGRWQVVLRGVYAVFTGELTQRQLLLAAQMYAGEQALITGAAALKQYRFERVPNTELVDVIIPHAVKRHSHSFVRVERTLWLPDRFRTVNELRLAPVHRAVMDACRRSRELDEVRAVMTEAVQQRRVPLADLERELKAGPMAWSARPRRAFADLVRGAQAVSECDLVAALIPSKVLPPVHFNCSLLTLDNKFLIRPDAYVEEVGLAGEVQSVEYHLYPEDQEHDMNRKITVGKHGVHVVEFRPSRIRRDPASVRSDFEETYIVRKAQGVTARVKVLCRPECPVRRASE